MKEEYYVCVKTTYGVSTKLLFWTKGKIYKQQYRSVMLGDKMRINCEDGDRLPSFEYYRDAFVKVSPSFLPCWVRLKYLFL